MKNLDLANDLSHLLNLIIDVKKNKNFLEQSEPLSFIDKMKNYGYKFDKNYYTILDIRNMTVFPFLEVIQNKIKNPVVRNKKDECIFINFLRNSVQLQLKKELTKQKKTLFLTLEIDMNDKKLINDIQYQEIGQIKSQPLKEKIMSVEELKQHIGLSPKTESIQSMYDLEMLTQDHTISIEKEFEVFKKLISSLLEHNLDISYNVNKKTKVKNDR